MDGNVAAFCPFTDGMCFVLGTDGSLWLEQGPFGHVPPPRQRVDSNVTAFEMVDNGDLYVLGSDGKIWLEHGPFTQVPPRREQVDALGLPSSWTWSGGLGFGSGPTNANFNFRLVLSSNGTANFSGQYNDTGSIPIFPSPAQNWVVAAGLPAGTKLLTFSATGNTPSAQSTNWNTSSSNQQIALAWPLIVGATVNYRVSDTSDLGGILNDIEQAASAVVEVVGIIAYFRITAPWGGGMTTAVRSAALRGCLNQALRINFCQSCCAASRHVGRIHTGDCTGSREIDLAATFGQIASVADPTAISDFGSA